MKCCGILGWDYSTLKLTCKTCGKVVAQGIEAQRAETLGSVHESPIAESDAPNLSNQGTKQ